MTTRYRLRLHLAHAIATALHNHAIISYSAAVRYCTRDYLTAFSIRKDTSLRGADWLAALQLVYLEKTSRAQDRVFPAQVPSFLRISYVAEKTKVLAPYVNSDPPE